MNANIQIIIEINFFLRKFLMFLHKNILICTPNYSLLQHFDTKSGRLQNDKFLKTQSHTVFDAYCMYLPKLLFVLLIASFNHVMLE